MADLGFSWAAVLTAIPAWLGAGFAWRNYVIARDRRREEVAARLPQFELQLQPCDGFPGWFEARLSITNRQDTSLRVEGVQLVQPAGAGLLEKLELEDQGAFRPEKARPFLPLRADLSPAGIPEPPPTIRPRVFFVHAPARDGYAPKRLLLQVKCLHRGPTERPHTYDAETGFPSPA